MKSNETKRNPKGHMKMAANANTKNQTDATEAEVEVTEATDPGDEVVQVLFKVSKRQRNQLKIVAMLEDKDGLQDLFSGIANELVERHSDALSVLTRATEAA